MELSRGAGARLQRRDNRQIDLLRDCVDRFWDELAEALESGPVLERSQQLVCALLEELKLTYLAQINRTGIDALIRELDQLTVPPATAAENQPMGAEASGTASTPRDQSP
jgi:hypothetical protein